jgi:hypothetical protein
MALKFSRVVEKIPEGRGVDMVDTESTLAPFLRKVSTVRIFNFNDHFVATYFYCAVDICIDLSI